MQSSIGNKIFYGVLSGAGRIVIGTLIALIQVRLVLKFLPKDLAGSWFLFLSLGYYIAYFDLGISPTISREISFICGQKGAEERDLNKRIADYISTCLRIFQVLAVAVFVLGLLAGVIYLINITSEASHVEIMTAWGIFVLGASLNLLGGAGFAAMYGLGDVPTERIIRTSAELFGFILSVLFLYLGFGIIGLSVSWAIQGVLGRLLCWRILYRRYPALKSVHGRADIEIVKKIAAPSFKWAAMSLGGILILQSDNIIIASLFGTSSIPPYEAATKMAMSLLTFSMLSVLSSTPFFSRAYAAGEYEKFRILLYRNVRYGMSLMLIFVVFLAFFADKVVNVWLGAGNFIGFPVVWTLFFMLTLEVHHVILASAVMSAGFVVFLWPALLAGVLKIALSVFFAKHYGMWGVALGTLIAQLLTNNWYAPYVAFKVFEIPFSYYFKTILFPLCIAVVVLSTGNMTIKLLLRDMSDLMSILIAFPLSMLIGLLTVSFIIITRDEKETIRKIGLRGLLTK